jgi:hypothetical protein
MAKLMSRYGIKEAPQNVMHQGEYQRLMSPQPSPGDLAARYAADLQGVDPKITAKAQQLGIDPTSQFLKPDEFARIAGRAPNIEGFNKIVSILPQAAEMASVAKAGEPKRGWYRASSQAILDVFGKEDAPRFAGLLAALSPQTSVESNLQNALRTWTNWEKAGRPTDPDQIRAVLGNSVQGNQGMGSVLPAWVPNSVTALSHPEPTKMDLSGFKVDSFMNNLLKDTQAVTNDAWMAHYGLPQADELLKMGLLTPTQAADTGPQAVWSRVPGYAAMTARTRQAADLAGVNPENVQESTWSVVKALSELGHGGVSRDNYLQQLALTHPDLAEKFAKPTGSSLQVLESGALTPNVVNSVPDFGSLMKDPQYGSLLADKYKDSIMDTPHPIWPDQVPLSTQDESHLQDVARRLDAANVTPSK